MPGTRAPLNAGHHKLALNQPISAGLTRAHALDDYLFEAPFLLLDTEGQAVEADRVRPDGSRPVLRFDRIDQARAALASHKQAAALVGTLRPGAWAVDIDPTDTGTAGDPVLGDAAAEALLAWTADAGLDQHVLRESGRPGGRHLVLDQVNQHQLAALRARAAELAAQLDIHITVRRPLRLLGSPHRQGLPAPVLSNTITPSTTSERKTSQQTAVTKTPQTEPSQTSVATGTSGDTSRSGTEFGRAMQCARAGKTAVETFADVLDCQLVDRGGYSEWLRYLWSAVVTTLAAERGHTEDQAWARLVAECPARADELGRAAWRTSWAKALIDAAVVDRPRRFRPYIPGQETLSDQGEQCDVHARRVDRQTEINHVREGLDAAAEALLQGRRPQVWLTMSAVIDAFAEAIVDGGRISVRRLAETARVADSTTELRRRELLAAGLLRRVATHRDDGQPCDLYALGPATMPFLEKTRVRSCTPPRPRLHGTANPTKLAARHTAQRAGYRPPPLNSTQTEAINKTYPDTRSHGSCVIWSRARHQQWWNNLTPAEQAERIDIVRARNARLDPVERDQWFAWLDRRNDADQAIDRLLAGTGTDTDRQLVDALPMTVHHGQRDPLWRVGGTQPTRVGPIAAQRPAQGRESIDHGQVIAAAGQLLLEFAPAAGPRPVTLNHERVIHRGRRST